MFGGKTRGHKITTYKAGCKGIVKEIFWQNGLESIGRVPFFETKAQLWSLQSQTMVVHNRQCFIIFLLPMYTTPPFTQPKAHIFILGFLKMPERAEVSCHTLQILSLTVREIAKGKGTFSSITLQCLGVFSSLSWSGGEKEASSLSTGNSYQVWDLNGEGALLLSTQNWCFGEGQW